MRRLLIPTETRWRDFLQPTMCRPRTTDIWTADIRRGGAACQQRSRQLCYGNATAHLRLRDADYGTTTRRRCGNVVQAKLYVATHSLSGPSERHLCKSTIIARQQQDRGAAARHQCSPAIIARLQRGAAARHWRFAARPSRAALRSSRSSSIVVRLEGFLCAVARQWHIPTIAVRHQRDHCATAHR